MSRLALVLALLSGCSIALQSKPKTAACSTTHGYWIADAVGVAAGVAAMTTAVILGNNQERRDLPGALGGVGAVGGVLYLASAGNGYAWTRQCRANQERAVVTRR